MTRYVNKRLFPNGHTTTTTRSAHPDNPTQPGGGSTTGSTQPVLPPPTFFDLPEKFSEWRVNQSQAVQDIAMCSTRFMTFVGPTGVGKSLIYIAAAVASGERTLVLTSTNPLLEQIMEDFGDLCVPIKGKSNYRCRQLGHDITCDKGPCNYGQSCQWRDSGCKYFDQVRKAARAEIVITNYAFWIYNNKARLGAEEGEQGGIGDFGMLICDEAHDSPNKVADAYQVTFSTRNEIEKYLLQTYSWKEDRRELSGWVREAKYEVEGLYKDAKAAGRTERTFQAATAKRKLKECSEILNSDGSGSNTVVVADKKWGKLRVAVAWPFDRSMQVLFRSIPKVVFTSATVRSKTVEMLGVDIEECTLVEYPHIIPIERRMLYHIPTIRLNFRTKDIEMQKWLTRIDQIAKPRLGTNGIVHPVSYARRNMILKASKYSSRMMSHGKKDLAEVIEQFKSYPFHADDGRILVSPSVTTGYDFPGDTARWQVIGKIAYPDTSDPVTKERCKRDDEYGPYVAMQTLVQTVGRIVRGADDWGESFIIDDNIGWFMQRYDRFAPGWFTGSYRRLTGVPQPMEF
jgi:Rad3-related DNA helicase